MKTDRSSVIRVIAVLLAGLLLMTGHPATGGSLRIGIGGLKITYESRTKRLAKALASQVKAVQDRFEGSRRALHTVTGSDGKPAFLRKDVSDLIDHTGKDLDDAIVKVQPSDLQPLRDWAADAIGRVQEEVKGPQGKVAVFPAGLFAPQPVEVIASLGNPPKKKPASPKAAKPAAPPAPPPDTVPADKSNGILDEVGKVVSRIFTLADKDDLEVKLWVGSTAPHTTFSFWPGGKIKGSTLAPAIIRTDGKKGGVVRGLYDYRAAWTQGKVTQIIQYPQPAGAQSTPTERLDLVNGTGFFCCRFNEQYCHAINNEKECRP
jgi:hypothetical protein